MHFGLKHPHIVLGGLLAVAVLDIPQAIYAQVIEPRMSRSDAQTMKAPSLNTRSHLNSAELSGVYNSSEYSESYTAMEITYKVSKPDNKMIAIPYDVHNQYDWYLRTDHLMLNLSDHARLLSMTLNDLLQRDDVQHDPKKLGQVAAIRAAYTAASITGLNDLVKHYDFGPLFRKNKVPAVLNKAGHEVVEWGFHPIPSSKELDAANWESDPVRHFIIDVKNGFDNAVHCRSPHPYQPYFAKEILVDDKNKPLNANEGSFIFQEEDAARINQTIIELNHHIQTAFNLLEENGFTLSGRKPPEFITYGTNEKGRLAVVSVYGQSQLVQPKSDKTTPH